MPKKIIFLFNLLFVFSFFSFMLVGNVLAEETPGCVGWDPVADPLGLKCAEATGLKYQDPRIVVGRIINVSLGLLGVLATGLIIFAGFKWMTAGGNEENVKKAQQILGAAVIGLVIILSAYALSAFALSKIYQATQGQVYGSGGY